MRIRAISKAGDPQPLVKEASLVLIENDDGTLIGVAASLGHGLGCVVAHPGDEDFNALVREFGIDRVTICSELEQTPINKLMEKPLV